MSQKQHTRICSESLLLADNELGVVEPRSQVIYAVIEDAN